MAHLAFRLRFDTGTTLGVSAESDPSAKRIAAGLLSMSKNMMLTISILRKMLQVVKTLANEVGVKTVLNPIESLTKEQLKR